MSYAKELAEQCVRETKTDRISRHASQVALVALSLLPDGEVDRKAFRRAISAECRQRYGSIFLIIVLPILVNLISNWIIRWLTNRKPGFPMTSVRQDARALL